jgi:hypothetical protein
MIIHKATLALVGRMKKGTQHELNVPEKGIITKFPLKRNARLTLKGIQARKKKIILTLRDLKIENPNHTTSQTIGKRRKKKSSILSLVHNGRHNYTARNR